MTHVGKQECFFRASARAKVPFDRTLYRGKFKAHVKSIERLWLRGFNNSEIVRTLSVSGLVPYMVSSIIHRCTPLGSRESAERLARKERGKQMLERYREPGVTFEKLAADYGVTKSGAAAIVNVAKRRERKATETALAAKNNAALADALPAGATAGVPSPFLVRIDALEGLSVRARNIIRAYQCEFLGDVAVMERSDFFRAPNIGRTTIAQIEDILSDVGLAFNQENYREPWRKVRSILTEKSQP